MCLPYDHIPTPSVDTNESDIWFESVSVAIWIVSRLPVWKHLWSLVGISHEVKPLIGHFHTSSKQCSRLQDYSMVTKKFPFFEIRYRAMVILLSVFISVPFYNFPCFYCCVSILKVRRKERLKNGAKTVQKTVRKRITVQRTFKKQCNNVKLQESKHECTDRTDGI